MSVVASNWDKLLSILGGIFGGLPTIYNWISKPRLYIKDFKIQKPFFKKALKESRYIHKKLSLKELENLFRKGCLISPSININVLENKKGYAGHAVLITDIDKRFITFHDPGLPPVPNNKIKRQDFVRSWRSLGTDNTVIVVFGKK